MEYYLPTYEEAHAIAVKHDNFLFYEKEQVVDGYTIKTFNYRLIGYNDFMYPLVEDSDVRAFELRGISYVFNKDGSLFKRYLLMNKFFNLNQVDVTQLDNLKDIKFKNVYDKSDGSVINFVKLPNGKTYAKSKMAIGNDQSMAAQKIYDDNENIQKLVEWALSRDIMPIFEYVSPVNKIVLNYEYSDLILLRLRDLNTGEYYDLDKYPNISDIRTAIDESTKYQTWDSVLEMKEKGEDIEGVVIMLEDNPYADMIKVKSEWYFERHFLHTETLHREDFIIKKIVNEEIDDVIAQLDKVHDKEVLDKIDEVSIVVHKYIKKTLNHVESLYNDYVENYKDVQPNEKYAIKFYVQDYGKKDKYFPYVISVINGRSSVIDSIKEKLIEKTYKLQKAREFVKKGDF